MIGQTQTSEVWIGENMSYFEISNAKAFIGFDKIDTFKYKKSGNQITLKNKRRKLRLFIIKSTRDSLQIAAKDNVFKDYFHSDKDTLLFISRRSFNNPNFKFVGIEYFLGYCRIKIDSSGRVNLEGNPGTPEFQGTFIGNLSSAQKQELSRLIKDVDITKLPHYLPERGFHSPLVVMEVLYYDTTYNHVFSKHTYGSYLPYILTELEAFLAKIQVTVHFTQK